MTHEDSAPRAGNASGDRVEAPASCGKCYAYGERIDAAFVSRRMSEWTDQRVLWTRHLKAAHPEQYRAEMVRQYALQSAHSEAAVRGRWVA